MRYINTILLVATATADKPQTALAKLSSHLGADFNITGNVNIAQNEDQPAHFHLQLSGLTPNTIHGWHIHDKPVVGQNCTTAGGHFNPKNVTHGAPDASIRHYGDFGNFKTDENGKVELVYIDKLASLFGEFTIDGRGIVIHEKEDDLGLVDNDGSRVTGNAGARLACGNIDTKASVIVATAELKPDVGSTNTVVGNVYIYQTKDSMATFNLQLQGLDPNTIHGWHIHDKPVVGQNCTTAGGHFNPKNVTHGASDASIRHYGGFGNFKADANGKAYLTITDPLASLFGEFTIDGRGVVVHALEDDLGLVDNDGSRAVGNAGKRLACGNIVALAKNVDQVDHAISGSARVTILFSVLVLFCFSSGSFL